MITSPTIETLSAALAKAQAELKPAPQDATNPHYNSKYADLKAVWESVRPVLAKYGLAVVQLPEAMSASKTVGLTTRLIHESGQWIESTACIPIAKDDPHGFGSGLTYLRRYALASLLGVISEADDDGNKAIKKPDSAKQVAVDSFEAMGEEEKKFLQDKAIVLIDLFENPGPDKQAPGAYYIEQRFDQEEKLAIWSLLPSALRREIKKWKDPSTTTPAA